MAASPSDPYLQWLLRLLADLGANAEQTREALEIYSHRPAGQQAQPAPTVPITPHNCAEPTGHVPLRKNMSKHKMPKSLGQNGSLFKQGKPPKETWYCRYRGPALTEDGTIRLITKHERLGPVSTISEAKAREELGMRISRTRTQPVPTASMSLRETRSNGFVATADTPLLGCPRSSCGALHRRPARPLLAMRCRLAVPS